MNNNQNNLLDEITESSSLRDIQKYVCKALELRGFNNQSPQDKILLLVEEVGELAKAIRKSNTNIAIDPERINNYECVESEIADVLIVLISLCNTLNVDIFKSFIEKEAINVRRTWINAAK